MQWKHKVSLDWMKERQSYLTASDVKNLVPVTKTGRNRVVTDLDRVKVMSHKMVNITEDDCWSYDAAARGHLLEPYAVAAYNDLALTDPELGLSTVFHWDDKLLQKNGINHLAYSPDALDVPMSDKDAVDNVTALVEVKCYNAEKHLTTMYTEKKQLEERWQIATAMAVSPTIEKACLVLFHPGMKFRKLVVIGFTRSELVDEIAIVNKVETEWLDFLKIGVLNKDLPADRHWSAMGGNEDAIIKEITERQRLNP